MPRPYLSPPLRAAPVVLLLSSLTYVLACSGSDEGGLFEGSGSAGSAGTGMLNIGGNSGSASGSGGSATVSSGGSGSCQLEDDGSGCVGSAYEGESLPVDIYIMFDQSGSMCSCIDPAGGQLCPDPNCAQTRLDAIRQATTAFLADPASQGIGVGIGYFGKQPIGEASCDAKRHVDPAVPIGLLPDNAGAISTSLEAIAPTGETPSGAAIRGACEYARDHRLENPDREVVLLLLTDGKPEAPVTCAGGSGPCCPSLSDAVDAAKECLEAEPHIKTYVLGVGPLLGNLAEIAQAGGTEHAYLVESGDVASEVLAALNQIRGDAIPCEFKLPPPPAGQELVSNQVNITYANAACEPKYYYYVESQEACASEGGWYYDDANAPEKVLLCPTSCEEVAAPGGRLLFTVGCATREVPR